LGARQLTADIVIPELCSIESKCEAISSKIDTISPMTIAPELWSLESKAEVISSKIDTLSFNITGSGSPCAPTPITASGSISGKAPIAIFGPAVLSDSGAYCLAQDIDATGTNDIQITGNTITIDLNSYTIKNAATGIKITGDNVIVRNGIISDATISGISLENSSNCRIAHVDAVGGPNGFALLGGGAHELTDCRALENSSQGFSLVASSTNNVVNCSAINTRGEMSAYGFIATGGTGNIFNGCQAQGIATTFMQPCIVDMPGWVTATAGGFVLNDTTKNKIIDSEVDIVMSTTGGKNEAYGIWIKDDITLTPTALNQVASSAAPDGTVYSVAWLIDGNTKYLATGGAGTNRIKVFEFT
jgi:parallel beta-helix repeat protein